MFPYQNNISWISKLPLKTFEEPFKEFANIYFDPEWSKILKQIIYNYVEANHIATSLECAIILLQSSLELLAYEILVEKNRVLSQTKFERSSSGERIKLLFDQLKIPLDISEHLGVLHETAKDKEWLTTDAITQIRNSIVHPTRKNRMKLNEHSQEAYEVIRLCKWSLELCVLKLCNYNGVYTNRLKRTQYQGDVDSVPWDS
jgi:hypothetical protein